MEALVSTLVAKVIRENTGRELDPAPTEPLISSGYLDSLSMVQLIIEMQESFAVQLAVEDLSADNFETVRAIASLICARPA